MARLAWLLVGCLVLAGCTAADPATTATVGESVENTPIDDSTVTADAGLSTQTPTGSGVRVTVTRVVDGDTLEISYRNGSTDTVRLLGVDTPEVHVAENPSEYEGVPDTDAGETCLGEAGDEASAFVSRAVGGETVRLAGNGRGRYGRLLAFVFHDGTNLNYRLVVDGYARVYDSQFRHRERFYRAEARAQRTHTGLWECADDSKRTATTASDDGPLAIAAIAADAPGNDNANLREETVTFENRGTNALALSGWTVRDEAGHTYSFPDGNTLAPGARLTLHTGRGTDTKTDRYWGSTSAVWNNNDGDTVIVEDAGGTVVTRRSYG